MPLRAGVSFIKQIIFWFMTILAFGRTCTLSMNPVQCFINVTPDHVTIDLRTPPEQRDEVCEHLQTGDTQLEL